MIGSFPVNILPIIMTLINFVSSSIYTKGFELKDKLQPFILAILFLIILYNSPSGLVIYWTMNNLISLIKIVWFKFSKINENRECDDFKLSKNDKTIYNRIVIFSTFSTGILAGLLIPTQIITSKPNDFVGWYSSFWPYINHTSSTYIGLSLWVMLFYLLCSESKKKSFAFAVFATSNLVLINYFCFHISFGFLSPLLRYDEKQVEYSILLILANLLVSIIILVVINKCIKSKVKIYLYNIPLVVSITFIIITLVNINMTIDQLTFKGEKKQYTSSIALEQVSENVIDKLKKDDLHLNFEYLDSVTNNELFPVNPVFKLSKKGKNVILLMMDKYQGEYFPYMLHEKPILKEQFKGFTYYPNTVSFGMTTIYGTPGLFGGYEYTPIEHDRKRPDELIKDNQNEALKVLPKMFHDEGYDCVVSNLPLENYAEKTNSIFDYDDPKDFIATKSNLTGKTLSKSVLMNIDNSMEGLLRNFLYYSLMKISPTLIQEYIYDGGRYLSAADATTMLYDMGFVGGFAVLERLCDYTAIVDDDSNNFFMMDNAAVHQPNMLSYPDFLPLPYTENIADKDFYDDKGNKFEGPKTYYTSTMGASLQIGLFLDYLRENGVYDNTRIVIVADHGYPSDPWEKYLVTKELNEKKIFNVKNIDIKGRDNNNFININGNEFTFTKLGFNPILLVKDFNSDDVLHTSQEFMTHADTPYILVKDVIDNPINPYTGNIISSDYKKNNDVLKLTLGHHYNWETRRSDTTYQYEGELWATIYDDIFNNDNWDITYSID